MAGVWERRVSGALDALSIKKKYKNWAPGEIFFSVSNGIMENYIMQKIEG